ncbi:hypothetical protein NC651_018797 [Populus alba x Populus x berolinensis]|nr:hypothetical protein NC651_018797 [Populus alba x Populus x berolinensis]
MNCLTRSQLSLLNSPDSHQFFTTITTKLPLRHPQTTFNFSHSIYSRRKFPQIITFATKKPTNPIIADPNRNPMDPNPSKEDFVHIESPSNNDNHLSESIVDVANELSEDDNKNDVVMGRKELPEELSRSVMVLTCESKAEGGTCVVHLVGTAHVSQIFCWAADKMKLKWLVNITLRLNNSPYKLFVFLDGESEGKKARNLLILKLVVLESCREVQAVVSYLKPQVVFLELCASRVAVLTPQNLKVPTMGEMIEMWKKNHNTFGILYSWFLAKVSDKLEVFPGSEFRVAFEEARKYEGKVVLGDRPVQADFEDVRKKFTVTSLKANLEGQQFPIQAYIAIHLKCLSLPWLLDSYISCLVDLSNVYCWIASSALYSCMQTITLQRTWGKMPLWHKVKLLYSLLFQALFLPSSEDLDKMKLFNIVELWLTVNLFAYFQLKEMDDVDMLTLVIQEMSKQFPTLMDTLVHERDQYMSSTLLRIAKEHTSVVAVVGKGHLQGIKKHWGQPVEISIVLVCQSLRFSNSLRLTSSTFPLLQLKDLMEIPSQKPAVSARKVLASLGVAVAGVAIFFYGSSSYKRNYIINKQHRWPVNSIAKQSYRQTTTAQRANNPTASDPMRRCVKQNAQNKSSMEHRLLLVLVLFTHGNCIFHGTQIVVNSSSLPSMEMVVCKLETPDH